MQLGHLKNIIFSIQDESHLVPLELLEQPELKSRMLERFDLLLPP